MALSRNQLEELKRTIDERYKALSEEIRADATKARADVHEALAGPVTDSGDEAVADLMSDIDNTELSRDLRELRELEAAQVRLADSTFGLCIDCGGDIDFDRLRAFPAALRCIECQRAHERAYAHPPEPRL
ncbi:MAG: TraR/DksA family transcriptional regulator [Burkholderiales bacterium]